jgi:hypothetical protein
MLAVLRRARRCARSHDAFGRDDAGLGTLMPRARALNARWPFMPRLLRTLICLDLLWPRLTGRAESWKREVAAASPATAILPTRLPSTVGWPGG